MTLDEHIKAIVATKKNSKLYRELLLNEVAHKIIEINSSDDLGMIILSAIIAKLEESK